MAFYIKSDKTTHNEERELSSPVITHSQLLNSSDFKDVGE